MARGLLTPPVSIVASESAFSAGGRTMTDRRTKLGVNSLKAVMCIRDWEAAEEREQGWQAMLEAEFKILELDCCSSLSKTLWTAIYYVNEDRPFISGWLIFLEFSF
ncbi:hypothetical protein LWI28_005604 [Acer negundo]|uniref:HAT C-terminal dimerisation domain-containing protein n=1 Tax=Acer negundo TaxID=4023 RepID=A0AAD5NL96_ACENE|nr:hypothetical protein LWI28_005604 [Acer negundo]